MYDHGEATSSYQEIYFYVDYLVPYRKNGVIHYTQTDYYMINLLTSRVIFRLTFI